MDAIVICYRKLGNLTHILSKNSYRIRDRSFVFHLQVPVNEHHLRHWDLWHADCCIDL